MMRISLWFFLKIVNLLSLDHLIKALENGKLKTLININKYFNIIKKFIQYKYLMMESSLHQDQRIKKFICGVLKLKNWYKFWVIMIGFIQSLSHKIIYKSHLVHEIKLLDYGIKKVKNQKKYGFLIVLFFRLHSHQIINK